jgi:hypothetical protein
MVRESRERIAKARADLETIDAGGAGPMYMPAHRIHDVLQDGDSPELWLVSPPGRNNSMRLDYETLLSIKKAVCDVTEPRKGDPISELHLTPPTVLTWGDMHALLGDLGQNDERSGLLRDFGEAHGYDGITHTGGWNTGNKEHKVWIAWKPQQIKATTAAKFDADDVDMFKGVA